MRKFRKNILQCFRHCFRAPRKIDNECLLPQSRHCPAEHCTVCDRHRISTDRICNAVCHPVADNDRGLRRHVSWGKSCPACCLSGLRRTHHSRRRRPSRAGAQQWAAVVRPRPLRGLPDQTHQQSESVRRKQKWIRLPFPTSIRTTTTT